MNSQDFTPEEMEMIMQLLAAEGGGEGAEIPSYLVSGASGSKSNPGGQGGGTTSGGSAGSGSGGNYTSRDLSGTTAGGSKSQDYGTMAGASPGQQANASIANRDRSSGGLSSLFGSRQPSMEGAVNNTTNGIRAVPQQHQVRTPLPSWIETVLGQRYAHQGYRPSATLNLPRAPTFTPGGFPSAQPHNQGANAPGYQTGTTINRTSPGSPAFRYDPQTGGQTGGPGYSGPGSIAFGGEYNGSGGPNLSDDMTGARASNAMGPFGTTRSYSKDQSRLP